MNEIQVDRSHYDFERYGFEGRFVSYYWQLREALAIHPASILKVGVGDKVFGNFIKSNTHIDYTSLDFAADLQPDVVGDILKLPFPDKSFDVACAFEVLEHLPFEQFDAAIRELARVARRRIILSVPHFGPMLSFSLKIPLLPQVQLAYKIPFPKTHLFNGQHYWELGKKGYPVRKVRAKLRAHGTLVRHYVPFNSAYHHFFVVELSN